jgi:aspartokinase-like uncharacterized kinase
VQVRKDLLGVPSLLKRLADVQESTIREYLPKLVRELDSKIRVVNEAIKNMPRVVNATEARRITFAHVDEVR